MIPKPEFCKFCPINHCTSQGVGEGYVPAKWREGSVLFVGEAAGEDEAKAGEGFVGGAGQWLRSLCKGAGIDYSRVSTLNVIGCRPISNVFPGDSEWHWTSRATAREGVEWCKEHHFWPALKHLKSRKVFALGNHSLEALTGRSGILQWRGSPLPILGDAKRTRVIPTLHPAYLMRQANLSSVVIGDLKKSLVLPPEKYNLFPTLEEVEKFKAREFAFDFEWDGGGNVTLCGLCDRFYSAVVVPFVGSYMEVLKGLFESAQALIGHNIIGADLAQFEKLGWRLQSECKIHDTMLKQHLVQPDYKHGLDFVASVFTNKVFWKGKWGEKEDEDGNIVSGVQWKSWDQEGSIPKELGGYGGCESAVEAFRLYNARDTDASYQINTPLSQLLRRFDLESIYWNVSVPVAYVCREIGEKGWRIDNSRLGEVRNAIDEEIRVYEAQLPEGLKPYEKTVSCNLVAPPGTYREKCKICTGKKPTKHEAVKITFLHPGEMACGICGRMYSSGKMAEAKVIKGIRLERVVPYNSAQQVQKYTQELKLREVRNAKTGRVTTDKRARKLWSGQDHPEFTLLGKLKEQVTLRNNFAKDSLLQVERMYFNLKVHGTSEGRLASSGRRPGIDLNIQNQPEEFRIIYVPDEPGWEILNLDITQGENMLTTWLARDWERWERLHQVGYDEHCDLASKIFNRLITKSKEDKPYRDVGKKINHGRNYGMGKRKQREFLLEEGFDYSEADVGEFIEIWRSLNSQTARWQAETIQIAERDGYLANPFGRKRWFGSRDYATKALAFLPASTLADMVLRMMIGHYPSRFREEIHKLKLGVFYDLVQQWRMAAQVHDSIVLMGPPEGTREQAQKSRAIITQEWPELFVPGVGPFSFGVDIKMSKRSWGEVKRYEV